MLSFNQIQELISRLPLTDNNYYIFEALLKQPYDIYRPIMDMLFDGTLVPEDLVMPSGALMSTTALANAAAARGRFDLARDDTTEDMVKLRASELASGISPGGVVMSIDQTDVLAQKDGSPGISYVPEVLSVVGADSSVITPSAISQARAASLIEAQKADQAALLAAMKPTIG